MTPRIGIVEPGLADAVRHGEQRAVAAEDEHHFDRVGSSFFAAVTRAEAGGISAGGFGFVDGGDAAGGEPLANFDECGATAVSLGFARIPTQEMGGSGVSGIRVRKS